MRPQKAENPLIVKEPVASPKSRAPSCRRRPDEFEIVTGTDFHNPRHIPRGMEALLLNFNEKLLGSTRRQCDEELAIAGADVLEGVMSASRDQNRVAVAQVLNLTRAPEAELAREDAKHFLFTVMHMHRWAGTSRNSLDPV